MILSLIAVAFSTTAAQGEPAPGQGQITPISGPDYWATPLGGNRYRTPDGNEFTWTPDKCPMATGEPGTTDGADDSFEENPKSH